MCVCFSDNERDAEKIDKDVMVLHLCRHLLLGGRKGHLASIDWRERRIVCEVQVGETIRDVW